MKRISEFLAVCFFGGEMLTIYTLVGCVTNGEPFPVWFRAAWYFYCGTLLIGLAGAAVYLIAKIAQKCRQRNNSRRRLGMVRMNLDTGRWYCERDRKRGL